MLPMINLYPHKPLIHNVAWKSSIYLVMAGGSTTWSAVRRRPRGRRHRGRQHKLLSEMVWPHFWAVQIVLAVLIVMYCTGASWCA